MNAITKKIVIGVTEILICKGIIFVCNNVMEGKTILGNKRKAKPKTTTDWKGRIWLGTQDYKIA